MKIIKWLKKELLSLIPPVIYFLVAFHFIYFMLGLTLEPGQTRYFTSMTVTLLALIMGKVLLITNTFSFIDAFPHKPLIYNIVWKLFMYLICMNLLWVVEQMFELITKHRNLDDILFHIAQDYTSPVLWTTEVWIAMVLLVFIVFTEFGRIIGWERVTKILFKSPR